MQKNKKCLGLGDSGGSQVSSHSLNMSPYLRAPPYKTPLLLFLLVFNKKNTKDPNLPSLQASVSIRLE